MPKIEYVKKIYDPIHLSYLAGIVDGEGCFCIGKLGTKHYHRCKSLKYQSQLRICNTKIELMEWIEDKFSNLSNHLKSMRRYMRKDHKEYDRTIYEWIVSGDRLLDISIQLLPYLVIKRRQCENIIRFRDTFAIQCKGGRMNFISPDLLKIREECYILNRQLNAKTLFKPIKHDSIL